MAYAQCIFDISWSCFVAHEITSVSGELELFPPALDKFNESELRRMVQARRKQLQIGGGAHIKSNYRLGGGGGGTHIFF